MAYRSCALSTAPWYDGRGGGQTWCNFPCAVIGWMGCLKHSCGFAHRGTSRHALTHRAQLREAELRTGARDRPQARGRARVRSVLCARRC